jgi:RNA 3'-terminal phosphate cyclase
MKTELELLFGKIEAEVGLLNDAADEANEGISEVEKYLQKLNVGIDVEINCGIWIGYGRVGGGEWSITYRADLKQARTHLLTSSREARIEAVWYLPNLLKEILERLEERIKKFRLREGE